MRSRHLRHVGLTLSLLSSALYCPIVARAHDPHLVPPSVLEAPPVPRPASDITDEQRVFVLVTLDAVGVVTSAVLDPNVPPPAAPFVDAALGYVRTVHFAPARHAEQGVPATVRFEVLFPVAAPSTGHVVASPPVDHVHAHSHTLVHTHPHETEDEHEHEVGAVAQVARPERSASSYTLNQKDLPRGAHVVAGDLARAVPGMFVVQHAGGGKANQYFLRGFDADHGTDIALSLDGVPINMVSHGHGQGYADLNWIIPELVSSVDVRKGSYDPRFGDFATAGAIDFQTGSALPQNQLKLEAGMFHSYRALALTGSQWGDVRLTGAAEVLGTDGPFQRSEDLKRVNLFARAAGTLGQGELSLTLTGYLSGWNASGQIPEREVSAGRLDRFGFVDRYEGGQSTRHNVYLRYKTRPEEAQRWDVLGYVSLYSFSLYSDFTFLRDDPLNGDMIHQRDERTLSGFKVRYERDESLGPIQSTWRFGIELRHDQITNGLDRAPMREWSASLVDADIGQTAASAYLESEIAWRRWLRTNLGVRGDAFGFLVHDLREDRETLGTRSSGEALATRVSPKASLTVSPMPWLSLYTNYGMGFHSNDARGVIQGVTPLTRADAYEAGLSLRLLDKIKLRLALFRVDLDSELVWVGDEGTTEASGRTRRQGLETDLHVDILPWLWGDVAYTWSAARFRDEPRAENQVPLAPRQLLTAKLTAMHPRGPFARLSMFYLGDRPANEDGSLQADGFTRVDLSAGYHHERFEVALSLENLLNTHWRESQFATVSRLRGETSAASCQNGSQAVVEGGSFVGCDDLHFTPGTPLAVRASASVYF
jgi:outer membrane receptor protein involved in Fe transport